MVGERGVRTFRDRRGGRLRAALLAGGLFLLSAAFGFEDPTCPHHRPGGAPDGGLTPGPANPAGAIDLRGEGAREAGDAEGDGSAPPCSCAGVCQVGGALLLDSRPPAAAVPAAITVAPPAPARDASLPAAPAYLLPYANAPPHDPST